MELIRWPLGFAFASNLGQIKPTALRYSFHPCALSTRNDHHASLPVRCPVMSAAPTNDAQASIVLSHFEAKELLKLRDNSPSKGTAMTLVHGEFSVDIGYNKRNLVRVLHDGINIPHFDETNEQDTGSSKPGEDWPVMVTWDELARMCKKNRAGAFEVFTDGERAPERITSLSDKTDRSASLLPVAPLLPPTLVLGGFTMHRMVGTNPAADTASKLACIPRHNLHGRVLDICTGLGYSALAAADSPNVDHVVTIELDPTVHDMIRRNPWSRRLASHEKVRMVLGEAQRVVENLQDDSFNVVLHDPPVIALAGHLYSLDFYQQLYRVCTINAALFHYIGDPSSKQSGKLFRGVKERLADAGFENIVVRPEAFGVAAVRKH